MVNVIARAWTSTIRNLLRPSELLYAIISCARFAAKPFAGLMYLGSDIDPTAYGIQAECITVELSDISRTNDNEQYPWVVKNAPEGIIRFGKSLSGECALVGTDFIYEKREYKFKTTPTFYATIGSVRGSTTAATFSVTFGNRLRITFEDLFNNYDGALDSIALKAARQHDEHLSCSNGMSGCTVLAACGVRAATTTSKVKATWTEGDKFLTATEHNELIVDIAKNAKLYTGATVSPASSITDAVNRRIALSTNYSFTDNVYKYYWIPEGETIATHDMPEKYRGNSSIDSVRLQALSDYPIKVYDTTYGPTDPGSNITLAKRITLASNVKLVQRLSVEFSDKYKFSEASRVILHIGSSAEEPTTKLVNGTCSLRYATYMYNCVEITDIVHSGNDIYAISLNGIKHTPLFAPGSYILGVGLASSYDEDILEYKSIDPVVIKAGACVALDIH